MWSLDQYRYFFVFVGLIGIILLSVPSASILISSQQGHPFSELYILGSEHIAEKYPFNVSSESDYSVYLGVVNHLGSSAFYEVDLKLLNSSEAIPNSASGVSSPLPVLYSYNVFLMDGQTWETISDFSFSNVTIRELSGRNVSSVGVMNISHIPVQVDKSVEWDGENSGYFYRFVVELWTYNATSNAFRFDGRFVSLWLNVTSSG